ncbi:protein N-lysine methyltransferase METTL21A [Arachis hypogaea]|uniref:Uncharacterized protein n=1 Tax=Arachis hypogaea TaxID=3818 RepID=A0A444Y2K2_ARAHY|nr:protein N-lysine methyltransferase METTL21A [Arachis hypogaea]RYQ96143.1 hypothetical protein Ahy_B08g091701 [Arachis hypogaea]
MSVQPSPFELRKLKPPSPVSPLASVAQPLPAGASSVPHHHVGHCLPIHHPRPLSHPRQLCPVPAFQDPASSLEPIWPSSLLKGKKFFLQQATLLNRIGRIDQNLWHPDYHSNRVVLYVLVKK